MAESRYKFQSSYSPTEATEATLFSLRERRLEGYGVVAESHFLPILGQHNNTRHCSGLPFLFFFFLISWAVLLGFSTCAADVTYSADAAANAARRQGLDDALRKYSLMALSLPRVRTGVVYNVSLTPYLGRGISAQVMRVRAGSLKRYGLAFNEFQVPLGSSTSPPGGGPFLVMAYRRLFNFTLYTPPPGFAFVGPTIGIIAFAASNVSFDDDIKFPEISLNSSLTPVRISLPVPAESLTGRDAFCAFFSLNGSITLRNITDPPTVCASTDLGDVSIVVTSSSPSPSSPPLIMPPPAPPASRQPSATPSSITSAVAKWKLAAAIAFGSIGIIAILLVLSFVIKASAKKSKLAFMERHADDEETLQSSLIGDSRAPSAVGIRTRPALEMDYSP